MAWMSVGTSNEDLCNKMVLNDVLKRGTEVLEAFRNTDRGDFVKPEEKILAYRDRPYKNEHIHISAPHMYSTVMEALDLKKGVSFLNVGSGSGYLSCLIKFIIGQDGICHGIDISEDAVQHSRECSAIWFAKLFSDSSKQEKKCFKDSMSFVCGNCFDVDLSHSLNCCRYDRIYVGAGCPQDKKEFFYSLLTEQGILVMPVNETNEMIRVKRISYSVFEEKAISNVHFAPLVMTDHTSISSNNNVAATHDHAIGNINTALAQEYSDLLDSIDMNNVKIINNSNLYQYKQQQYRCSNSNKSLVKLPDMVWAPTKYRHKQFPVEFRAAVHCLLMISQHSPVHHSPKNNNNSNSSLFSNCSSNSHRGHLQQHTSAHLHQTTHHVMYGSCCNIPLHIWLYIITFANRDWFKPVKSEVTILSEELVAERRLRKHAEEQWKKADTARKSAEREKDTLRAIISRMNQRGRLRLLDLLNEETDVEPDHNNDDEEEDEEEEEEEEEEEDNEMNDDDEEDQVHVVDQVAEDDDESNNMVEAADLDDDESVIHDDDNDMNHIIDGNSSTVMMATSLSNNNNLLDSNNNNSHHQVEEDGEEEDDDSQPPPLIDITTTVNHNSNNAINNNSNSSNNNNGNSNSHHNHIDKGLPLPPPQMFMQLSRLLNYANSDLIANSGTAAATDNSNSNEHNGNSNETKNHQYHYNYSTPVAAIDNNNNNNYNNSQSIATSFGSETTHDLWSSLGSSRNISIDDVASSFPSSSTLFMNMLMMNNNTSNTSNYNLQQEFQNNHHNITNSNSKHKGDNNKRHNNSSGSSNNDNNRDHDTDGEGDDDDEHNEDNAYESDYEYNPPL